MGRIEETVVIDAPIESVFELIANGDNAARWHTSVRDARHLTPPPIKVGSRLLVKAQVGRRKFGWVQEVTGWESMKGFSDRMVSGLPSEEDGFGTEPPFKSFEDWGRFKEVEGGVEVTFGLEYRLPGGPIGSLIDMLFLRRSVSREVKESLSKAQEIVLKGK